MSGHFVLRTDGGARGNPGPAGIGVVLEDSEGNVVDEIARGIGWATNNVAEYTGLIEGLKLAVKKGVSSLAVFMDSVLVVQQVRGVYKVRNAGLKPLHAEARALVAKFGSVDFKAVPREQNEHADRLMNEGIDRWLEENPGFRAPAPPQSRLF